MSDLLPHPIPILADNYVWCLPSPHGGAWVVDPGDAAPVRAHLQSHGWTLEGILVTHWHPDHIGGIDALRVHNPCPVYAPAAEAERIPMLTHAVADGDLISLPVGDTRVMAVPGHTLGHVAFHIGDWLFCGDTLFSGGCGRLFEGTPEQMHASLTCLATLPSHTRVACTHEYTLANLAFALAVEPDNRPLRAYRDDATTLRDAGHPTLPSAIAHERSINPFLRCDQPAVRAAAERHAGRPLTDEVAVFAALRAWKDNF